VAAQPSEHWEGLYRAKAAAELSWFEPLPRRSLDAIQETGVSLDAPILDVGGGASLLVDNLLLLGYTDLTVLDLAPAALALAKNRLGGAAERVSWMVGDITVFRPRRRYAVWHDRAVLHFLRDELDQKRYVETLRAALAPGGHLVLATFGPGGPHRCSGLPVQRHSVESLSALLGREFGLQSSTLEDHLTPAGLVQRFLHTRWRVEPWR
jgi:SAM-dependent methyltransferase